MLKKKYKTKVLNFDQAVRLTKLLKSAGYDSSQAENIKNNDYVIIDDEEIRKLFVDELAEERFWQSKAYSEYKYLRCKDLCDMIKNQINQPEYPNDDDYLEFSIWMDLNHIEEYKQVLINIIKDLQKKSFTQGWNFIHIGGELFKELVKEELKKKDLEKKAKTDINPCPICGSDCNVEGILREADLLHDRYFTYQILCEKCGYKTYSNFTSLDEARTFHNNIERIENC